MEQRSKADPAQTDAQLLEALVRCLARIAAEDDYAAYGGSLPPPEPEKNS